MPSQEQARLLPRHHLARQDMPDRPSVLGLRLRMPRLGGTSINADRALTGAANHPEQATETGQEPGRTRHMARPRTTIEQRDMANRAAALRRAGASYDDIATAIGYKDKSSAWKAVQRVLAAADREQGTALVQLELDRIDRLQRAVWQLALRGDDKAINTTLRLMDHRAKLAKLYDLAPSGDSDDIRTALAGLLAATVAHPLAAQPPPGSPLPVEVAPAPQPEPPAPQKPAQPYRGGDEW